MKAPRNHHAAPTGLRRLCLVSCTIDMSLLRSWPVAPNARTQRRGAEGVQHQTETGTCIAAHFPISWPTPFRPPEPAPAGIPQRLWPEQWSWTNTDTASQGGKGQSGPRPRDGRKTDCFGVDGRLSLTPRFSGVIERSRENETVETVSSIERRPDTPINGGVLEFGHLGLDSARRIA